MTDSSPEVWWLLDSLAAAGYVVIVVLALLVGQGRRVCIILKCPPELRVRHTLTVAKTEAKK